MLLYILNITIYIFIKCLSNYIMLYTTYIAIFLYRYMIKKSRRIECPNNPLLSEILSYHQVLGTSELQNAY